MEQNMNEKMPDALRAVFPSTFPAVITTLVESGSMDAMTVAARAMQAIDLFGTFPMARLTVESKLHAEVLRRVIDPPRRDTALARWRRSFPLPGRIPFDAFDQLPPEEDNFDQLATDLAAALRGVKHLSVAVNEVYAAREAERKAAEVAAAKKARADQNAVVSKWLRALPSTACPVGATSDDFLAWLWDNGNILYRIHDRALTNSRRGLPVRLREQLERAVKRYESLGLEKAGPA